METHPFFHLEWLWIVLVCFHNFKIENVHKLITSLWNWVYFLSECQNVGQQREWYKNPIGTSSPKMDQAEYIVPRGSLALFWDWPFQSCFCFILFCFLSASSGFLLFQFTKCLRGWPTETGILLGAGGREMSKWFLLLRLRF